MAYRIAGRVNPRQDLTRVQGESQFARAIRQLFLRIRPRRVIETGTYHGTGTTSVIASTLKELGDDATFFSIEVNPKWHLRALQNLAKQDLHVAVLNGLSVPRRLLPTLQQIQQQYVEQIEADDLYVDHEEADRAAKYFAETDFPAAADDLLGVCLRELGYCVDFLLLDSGGHMGGVEFEYVLPLLKSPCYVALDDIYHVKHARSFRQFQADSRFDLVTVSEEKFGFCIARFTPERAKD